MWNWSGDPSDSAVPFTKKTPPNDWVVVDIDEWRLQPGWFLDVGGVIDRWVEVVSVKPDRLFPGDGWLNGSKALRGDAREQWTTSRSVWGKNPDKRNSAPSPSLYSTHVSLRCWLDYGDRLECRLLRLGSLSFSDGKTSSARKLRVCISPEVVSSFTLAEVGSEGNKSKRKKRKKLVEKKPVAGVDKQEKKTCGKPFLERDGAYCGRIEGHRGGCRSVKDLCGKTLRQGTDWCGRPLGHSGRCLPPDHPTSHLGYIDIDKLREAASKGGKRPDYETRQSKRSKNSNVEKQSEQLGTIKAKAKKEIYDMCAGLPEEFLEGRCLEWLPGGKSFCIKHKGHSDGLHVGWSEHASMVFQSRFMSLIAKAKKNQEALNEIYELKSEGNNRVADEMCLRWLDKQVSFCPLPKGHGRNCTFAISYLRFLRAKRRSDDAAMVEEEKALREIELLRAQMGIKESGKDLCAKQKDVSNFICSLPAGHKGRCIRPTSLLESYYAVEESMICGELFGVGSRSRCGLSPGHEGWHKDIEELRKEALGHSRPSLDDRIEH